MSTIRNLYLRLALALLAAIMLSGLVSAQDTLFMTDGSQRIVKILQVNPDQIKYKPAASLDDQTLVIGIDYVSKVVYENGSVGVFMPYAKTSAAEKGKISEVNFNKNAIIFNAMDLLLGSITMSYERFFNKGYFGIRVPFSVGTTKLKEGYSEHQGANYFRGVKVVSTGFDFNFYPFGRESVTYFVGISCDYGVHKYNDRESIGQGIVQEKGAFSVVGLNNGVLINFNSNLMFGINLGFGFLRQHSFEQDYSAIMVIPGLNIGYKF